MTDPLAQCLALLVEVFPKPDPTANRLAVYRRVLADLTPTECERAFMVLSREHGRRFFPSPGEILEAARPDATIGGVAALFDRIEAAIFFRRATLSRIAEEFGVAAMEAVQACGGLQAIRSPGEYRVVRLKEFSEAYRELARCSPEKLLPPPPNLTPNPVRQLVETVGRGMALPTGDRDTPASRRGSTVPAERATPLPGTPRSDDRPAGGQQGDR